MSWHVTPDGELQVVLTAPAHCPSDTPTGDGIDLEADDVDSRPDLDLDSQALDGGRVGPWRD